MDRPSYPPAKESSPKKSLRVSKSMRDAPLSYSSIFKSGRLSELNQVLIEHMDMEEIYKLYTDENYKDFEVESVLEKLSKRFGLPKAKNFDELLKSYDMKYATVRSYHYKNRTTEEVFYQACLEGNIQAMINGLKMYPKLRDKKHYDKGLMKAARGGHMEICNMMLDLGADDYAGMLDEAARGGHLNIFNEALKLGAKFSGDTYQEIGRSGNIKLANRALAVYSDLKAMNDIIYGAAIDGHTFMVDYFIEKGANPRYALEGAIEGDQIKLIDELLPITNREDVRVMDHLIGNYVSLEALDLLVRRVPDLDLNRVLMGVLVRWERPRDSRLVEYLLDKGASTNAKYIERAIRSPDVIKVFIDKGVRPSKMLKVLDWVVDALLRIDEPRDKEKILESLGLIIKYLQDTDPEELAFTLDRRFRRDEIPQWLSDLM